MPIPSHVFVYCIQWPVSYVPSILENTDEVINAADASKHITKAHLELSRVYLIKWLVIFKGNFLGTYALSSNMW